MSLESIVSSALIPGASMDLRSTVLVSPSRCVILVSKLKDKGGDDSSSLVLSIPTTANRCKSPSGDVLDARVVPFREMKHSEYPGGIKAISIDWPASTTKSNTKSTSAPITSSPINALSRSPRESSIPIDEALTVTDRADLMQIGGKNGLLSNSRASSAESLDESAVQEMSSSSVLGTTLTVLVTGSPIDSKLSPRTFMTISSACVNILSLTVSPFPVCSLKKFLIWSEGIPS